MPELRRLPDRRLSYRDQDRSRGQDGLAPDRAALVLVRKWLADDPAYDAEVFPVLKAELDVDRLSYRRRFKE